MVKGEVFNWKIIRNDEIEINALISEWSYTAGTNMIQMTMHLKPEDILKITELIKRTSPINMRWSATSVKDK